MREEYDFSDSRSNPYAERGEYPDTPGKWGVRPQHAQAWEAPRVTDEELHEKFGVTGDQLDAWADEYESEDWSHMRFAEVIKGRPRFSDEDGEQVQERRNCAER